MKKKAWISPELTVHGKVEELTHGKGKQFGSTDGYYLITPTQGLCDLDAVCS